MEVVLYSNFKKRRNSTKQPGEGVVYDCILKEATSALKPTIEINVGIVTNMTAYNYAYIPDFSRYYYVDWDYHDGLWSANCTVDAMATYRQDIGAANLYLLRAGNAYNSTIADADYTITSQVTTEVLDGQCPWIRYDEESAGGSTGGLYVIGIAGAGNNGAVTYYGMDKLYFQQFSQKLFNTTTWLGIDWDTVVGLSEQILKALVNPSQYIISAKWYPLDVFGQGIPLTDKVKFGWWEIEQQCYIVNFPSVTFHIGTLAFPRHPQAISEHGDFTDFKPYSYYYFYTEPFGIIELDRSDFREETVNVDVWIDMITGEAELRFLRFDQKIVKSVKVPFAVDVPLLQMTVNYLGVASGVMNYYSGSMQGIAQTALSAKSGNLGGEMSGIANTISNMVGGIANTASALIPQGTVINEQSSYMDFLNNTYEFRAKHYMLSPLSRSNIGQALCETRQVRTVGGFMLPAETGFEMGGTLEEKNEVRSIMEGGFYYE